ncbi:NAD-dependent epimerase/dehydratase family protein [Paenisporosarcina sp. NPDC076898]|uniref:NAD-dependent epimerase/dehydratase family protein n=1 Tax=unclassified Paenisporosarcina TaxID=2642018 RepID=UPI003D0179D3
MKFVVTGGAGFIGSHLVDALILSGAEVHILDNLVSGQLENVNKKAELHIVDICSAEAKNIILGIKPDAVFHLAAQADVGKSVQDPQYDADINIKGTINILEACRDSKVKKFIFASTSAVYGNLSRDLLTEDEATNPASYYGLSKLTAEGYIRLFYELYRLPFTILRYANVFGPRQLPKGEGGVIAVFLNRMREGKSLSVHGDGEQTRDFIYVSDIVAANLAALNGGSQETIQVSTSKKYSINELLKLLAEINGHSIQTIHTASREGDIKHSCLCNKKAQQILGWQPLVNIQDGMIDTYDYYQSH